MVAMPLQLGFSPICLSLDTWTYMPRCNYMCMAWVQRRARGWKCSSQALLPLRDSYVVPCASITSQDADVDGESPSSLGQLEAYAEDTASSLLYLALETCGVR